MICCCLLQLPLTCPWCFFLFAWYFRHRVFHIYTQFFIPGNACVSIIRERIFFIPRSEFCSKKKICLHAECIPIDRLRWHHIECAMHFFRPSFAFIEWTNSFLPSHIHHVVWLVISSILLDFGIRIAFVLSISTQWMRARFTIPSLHWGGTNGIVWRLRKKRF